MNIAFLISSRAMAGMELRAARVARLAKERGHEMHFGCPAGSQLDRLLHGYGVRRFPLYIRGSLDLYSCLRLARYLRRHGVWLVMPFSGKDYWMTVLAARLAGISVLINRSTANSPNPLSVPVMSSADGIVSVSRGIRDVLVDRGIPKEKVRVVYLGVNEATFSPEAYPPKERLREKYGLPQGKFIVGSLSRSGKGQKIIMETDELLADYREHLCYFFAGEYLTGRLGPIVERIPALRGRVFLRDLVPHGEVPEYLKALDLVVMLPEREPFSNSVIEAMAMGRPVILSRILGNIEAVEDGTSGILIDRSDRRALAQNIRALLESPEKASAMGHRAAERVRRLFTEEVMMDRMEKLWAEAVKPD